ncbi:hypothetical protein ABD87_22610 [Lysinibacillus sphaericus]|uniref:hypothetical protein n=1 Tax=Lysinibacillus sphaericus TaxID=1421 RepID=UPI0018CCAF87|nr:hypothetical protein [Lysinibacillus sphaericus]MBG9732219.1 hypothetical protein [Lysinibacillus sphaericus]
MNIEAIYQNAEIISSSVCGCRYNRVAISYDEFAFLTELTGADNPYKGYGDDFVEMDYHGEFMPLIKNARNLEEQKLRNVDGHKKASFVEDFITRSTTQALNTISRLVR